MPDRPAVDGASANGRSNSASSGGAILLVDDDHVVARAIRILFEMAGYRIDIAVGPEEAYSRLATARYDAILLDLNFTAGETSGDDGLACLERVLADDPAARVIVITAHSGIRVAVAAMQRGARDFIMKPWRNAELVIKVKGAIAHDPRQVPVASSPESKGEALALLGDSAGVARVRDVIRRIGPTAASVAITGPSGSGRTLTARVLHAASPNAQQALVQIDLRDPTMWDRLDDASDIVVLRHPDRLDELLQSRLLARLRSSVRSIAIAESLRGIIPALRSRIATIEIALPPLRERDRDAIELARHFARVAAERHGLSLPQLTPAAEALVLDTTWSDEVRGLSLAIERAVLLATDGIIDAAALAMPVETRSASDAAHPAFDLSNTERAMIAAALREHHHNVTQAASALGLSRGAMYRRMERYGL